MASVIYRSPDKPRAADLGQGAALENTTGEAKNTPAQVAAQASITAWAAEFEAARAAIDKQESRPRLRIIQGGRANAPRWVVVVTEPGFSLNRRPIQQKTHWSEVQARVYARACRARGYATRVMGPLK